MPYGYVKSALIWPVTSVTPFQSLILVLPTGSVVQRNCTEVVSDWCCDRPTVASEVVIVAVMVPRQCCKEPEVVKC